MLVKITSYHIEVNGRYRTYGTQVPGSGTIIEERIERSYSRRVGISEFIVSEYGFRERIVTSLQAGLADF